MREEDLPNGWEETSLPEFTHIEMGQSPPSTSYNLDGIGLPFFQGKAEFTSLYPVVKKYCSEPSRVAEEGATLLSVRAPVGPTNIANQRCCIGRGLAAIHPLDSIPSLFIFYLLQSREQEIARKGTGSTFTAITRKDLHAIPIPLPPLAEQKRIVAKIEELFSELDAGEESLRHARRQLSLYRQSLLKQAFEGKLTGYWRSQNPDKLEPPEDLLARIQAERQKRHEERLKEWEELLKNWENAGKHGKRPAKPRVPKSAHSLDQDLLLALSDLPPYWFWYTLGLMTLGVEYGTAAKSQKIGKCPVIRMGNLQGGEIDWGDLVFTSDEEEIEQYLLNSGDVLFNRTNSPELVGKTAIYRGTRPAVFAGYLIRINQLHSIIAGGYLNYFLNSGIAKQYSNNVKTDGVNQSNINGEKLCSYPFPFCSLPEQHEIVRILDEQFAVIEENERELDAALARSAALRQSILRHAFTGKLVPQDPTDEPASELLARIKARSARSVKSVRSVRSQKNKPHPKGATP